MAVCVPSNVEITHNKICVVIATEKIRRDQKKRKENIKQRKKERKRKQTDTQRAEGEVERVPLKLCWERERERESINYLVKVT